MSLHPLINKYQLAVYMFGADSLYEALKREYSDSYNSGDIIINALIETLHINLDMPVQMLMRKLSIIRDPEMYRYYLEDTLDNWINSKQCPS